MDASADGRGQTAISAVGLHSRTLVHIGGLESHIRVADSVCVDVCFPGLSVGERGPCLGWNSPAGVAVNLAFWIGIVAFVILAVRVIGAVRRDWPIDSTDVKRILGQAPNVWLFFGSWALWFGAWIVANAAT